MSMKTYLEDAAVTASKEPKLDLEAMELSNEEVLAILIGHKVDGDFADATKRALFYSDTKVEARLEKAEVETIRLSNLLEEHPLPEDILGDKVTVDLVHSLLGIVGEAGEICEELVASKLENRELNRVNIGEELGDILWYIALAVNTLDLSFDEIAKRNINKLRIRYPDNFSKYDAINRDTTKELNALV